MNLDEEVKVKRPDYTDLEELYGLIKVSTSNRTRLTLDSLEQAVFERHKPESPPPTESDSWFEFELNSIRSDKPVAQALVAEMRGQLVGYIISHYHYSPWIGHGINIDDIYVKRNLSKRDLIERKLIEHVMDTAKLESVRVLFFDSHREEFNFIKHQCKWYRNNKDSDWSLLQISSQFG